MKVQNYIEGKWYDGEDIELELHHAITGERIGSTSSLGIDYVSVLNHAKNVGGPALRKMTFQERGRMLKALALHLTSIKEKFYSFLTKPIVLIIQHFYFPTSCH